MNQDGSIALFQYWNRLRGNRPAPLRTDIEPADIKGLLADTFILERNGRGNSKFRLAGTRLCAIYGKELKGYSFSSFWAVHDQNGIERLVNHTLDDKAVCVVSFEGRTEEDRLNRFEMVLLPLEGKPESRRALGTVQPIMKPFWLGADPIVENHLENYELVDPNQRPVHSSGRPAVLAPSLSPDGEMLIQQPGEGFGRRIRHLVVYQGGRAE